MFAFLFDRRSGLQTTVILSALALLLFGGGVLVGLNLRWSRDQVASVVEGSLTTEASPAPLPEPSEPKPAAAAKPAVSAGKEGSPATSEALPEDWVPMTSGGGE